MFYWTLFVFNNAIHLNRFLFLPTHLLSVSSKKNCVLKHPSFLWISSCSCVGEILTKSGFICLCPDHWTFWKHYSWVVFLDFCFHGRIIAKIEFFEPIFLVRESSISKVSSWCRWNIVNKRVYVSLYISVFLCTSLVFWCRWNIDKKRVYLSLARQLQSLVGSIYCHKCHIVERGKKCEIGDFCGLLLLKNIFIAINVLP